MLWLQGTKQKMKKGCSREKVFPLPPNLVPHPVPCSRGAVKAQLSI